MQKVSISSVKRELFLFRNVMIVLVLAWSGCSSVTAAGATGSCSTLGIFYSPDMEVFDIGAPRSGPATFHWIPGRSPTRSATTRPPMVIHDALDTDTPVRLRSWIPGFSEVPKIDLEPLRKQTAIPSLAVRSIAGWLSPHELVYTVYEPPETVTYLPNSPYEDREYTYLRQAIAVWDATTLRSRLVTDFDSFREALFVLHDETTTRLVFRSKGRKFGDLRLSDGQVMSEFDGSIARFSAVDKAGALIVRLGNNRASLIVATASRGLSKIGELPAANGTTVAARWVRGDVAVRADGASASFVTEEPFDSLDEAKRVTVRTFATDTGKRIGNPVSVVLSGSTARTQVLLSATSFRRGVAFVDDGYIVYVRNGHTLRTKTRLSTPNLTFCTP